MNTITLEFTLEEINAVLEALDMLGSLRFYSEKMHTLKNHIDAQTDLRSAAQLQPDLTEKFAIALESLA
jgi:hypothetical protein